MAWTAPKTWTVGEVLTAASLNTHLRDNLLAGWELIDDLTVAGSVLATYDTNTRLGGNLPTTYKHLRLVVQARSDGGSVYLRARFNNDATAIYARERALAANATVGGENLTGLTSIDCGICTASTDTAGRGALTEILIPDYNGATFRKMLKSSGGGVAATNLYAGTWWGEAAITAALTRLQVFPDVGNFAIGSRFTLYGLV